MNKLKSIIAGLALASLLAVPCLAQGVGQLGSGQMWANPTSSQGRAQPTGASGYFDFVYGSTRGAILERGASGWAKVNPSATALPWVSNGAGADPAYQVLGIIGGGTNCGAASGTCLDNITGFSSTGYAKRTGAGAYSFVNPIPLADGGTGAGTQQAALNAIACTPTRAGDVMYYNGTNWVCLAGNNSGTQVLQETSVGVPSWVTVSGTGTVTSVTPGGGIVSSTTASCSQTAITTSGTLSAAHCVNAQTGASYAIADGDRAKLITASNAGAQAYTIAQAGAASAFAGGWFTDIHNISTNIAGIVTVTPTTSTINGASTLSIYPGQTVRIVSDGTNYQTADASVLPSLTNSLGADQATGAINNYTVGPTVAQGTSGTWNAVGSAEVVDTSAAVFVCKLWDGTTVIDSGAQWVQANQPFHMTFSGSLTAPAGNIRISCADSTNATGTFKFNVSGNSKDSTLTVVRIQ